MYRQMKWLLVLLVGCLAAALVVACSDRAMSTSPSSEPSVSGDPASFGLAGTRAHDDDDSDDQSDDDSDDDSDDESDSESDDAGSDDDSSDDDNGAEGGDADDDRARGLFFGIEPCPADSPECALALRIKDTLVIVTADTEVDNEPALTENLTPEELEALISDNLGLPLRARGTAAGGALIASEVRIDDEIRASGVVVAPAVGCDVSLEVRAGVVLCFVAPGLESPPVGSQARIEGLVPVDLVSPYRALEIERTDD